MAKGDEGMDTGGSARKLIEGLGKCMTHDQIGERTGRSGSTIGQIATGSIVNPPKDLIDSLKKIPKCGGM